MVRPIWRSQSCTTCRKRKVRCDGARPICMTCQKAKRVCEPSREEGSNIYLPGLSRQTTKEARDVQINMPSLYQFLLNWCEDPLISSPSDGPMLQVQFLSSFMPDYLPKEAISDLAGSETSLSWFEPEQVGQRSILEIALVGLSLLFAGRKHNNEDWVYWSQRYYSDVLTRLYNLPQTDDPDRISEVIGAAMVLAVYELYNYMPGQSNSWMIHIQAAWKMLEEQGPNMPIDSGLLRRVRTVALYDACGRRKSTFLAEPEWRAQSPKDDPYDILLDILLPLPLIQELADKIRLGIQYPDAFNLEHPSEDVESVKRQFMRQFSETEKQLREWYLQFLNSNKDCPFVARTATLQDLNLLQGSPELFDVFPEVIEFPNRYVSQIFFLSWLGFLILYYEVAATMQMLNIALERPSPILLPHARHEDERQWFNYECSLVLCSLGPGKQLEPRTFQDMETVAEVFAVRLCQAMALCDKSTLASAMRQPILPTFWAATQFFKDRSPRRFQWCRTVLRNFTYKGVRYGPQLASLPYDRYREMGSTMQPGAGYVRKAERGSPEHL